MQTTHDDLPTNGQSTLNGNGSNGKKFNIVRAGDDELTKKILRVRERVQEWPRRKRKTDPGLIGSEKSYFCWLLDRSLHPKFNERPGVVIVSEQVAARTHGVCKRTIWQWKWNLAEITGELWIGKNFRPNMFPGDCYHIAVLDPKKDEEQYTRDGIYGGKKMRGAPVAHPGARAKTQGQGSLHLPGSRQPNRKDGFVETEGGLWVPSYSQVPDTAAENGNALRRTAELDCGGQPQLTAALSRS